MGLLRGLHDPDRVGNNVAYRGRDGAAERAAHQLQERAAWNGDVLLQAVHDHEPRVVPNDIGEIVALPTGPQNQETSVGDLRLKHGPALGAVCLQHGLASVDGGDEDAPARAGHGSAEGGEGDRQLGRQRAAEPDDEVVGGDVAEAGERRLEDGPREEALVEAGDATLLVQLVEDLEEGTPTLVLVVHHRPQPHEGQDLDRAGEEACGAAADCLLHGLDDHGERRRLRGLRRCEAQGHAQGRARAPAAAMPAKGQRLRSRHGRARLQQ
mmetsp:Transcript_4524/g.12790  ORF Transcript_4524/g.12790 Transcript_4524/m.12790 type:complete len:268 (+) Transcript_4524:346-1149(+)